MNFLSFSIFFDVLETLDQRAFNALFRVPNNVLSEKVSPLYEKGQKTFRFDRITWILSANKMEVIIIENLMQ